MSEAKTLNFIPCPHCNGPALVDDECPHCGVFIIDKVNFKKAIITPPPKDVIKCPNCGAQKQTIGQRCSCCTARIDTETSYTLEPWKMDSAPGLTSGGKKFVNGEQVEPAPDMVNHPPHYTQHPSGVECIEITRHMNFNLGNALKYIWRAGLKKDAIEDLKKSIFYLSDEIARIEKENEH